MSSIDPIALKDHIAFMSKYPMDKILYEQNTPITHSVSAAVDGGGGFYMPKTDIKTIANPIGKKAFITMKWSIDGVNYYPAKPILYNPGNPIPAGKVGATVGCSISATEIKFYFTHYIPSTVNFSMKYVLDSIL